MLKAWKIFFEKTQLDIRINNMIEQIFCSDKVVYPSKEKVLSLFDLIEPKDIKVVIVGQDPYHNPKQANGIAFSASNDVKTPKSLLNIFTELKADLNIDHFYNNDLSGWVKQGVLLINTSWTVIENQPASHAKLGWEDIVIKILNELNIINQNIVYCLWGNYAKKVYEILDYQSSAKITSAHPSPLSYSRGFKESKPFSKINEILKELGIKPIDWSK
ncbi:uracil-DNA glycosylase [Entomoplasma ellychniae]|uniref:Uracil-DNA glycosylase n=1 Tax=Entomoplasma ellychniae TaxID=2114 RepID=A0A8E2QWL8_9MOLU|nr:uracil-DNA glycosylase [Entomoplasma ellychniae]PPE05037.1 uracil-DNA glycosylase [Entomoplasma ellychniae]